MIDAENLTRRFGNVVAVDKLTFHVEEGEIFGFLGPNGAGKTTTVRMLTCLISSTSGTANISGYDINKSSDSLKIRKLIGLIPDSVGLYDELSAYDNLDFYGRLYECDGSERKSRISHFLKTFGLWEKRDLPVGTFSKGMKQKVAIARALIHDPQLLFLDEPTANLDPESAKTVRDIILGLKKEGKTIFLNTHNLDEAQRICDRIGVLRTRLLAIGTPEQLKRSLWRSKTVIQVEKVSKSMVSALKKASAAKVSIEGNRLVVEVDNPEKQNPGLIDAVTSAGGQVQFVTELNPTLEDVYLKIVGEKE